MQFTHETRQLLAGFLLVFGVIAIIASYWSITGAVTILPRDDNARLVEAEAAIVRGTIYDRNGEPLVESIIDDNGVVSRAYLDPAIYGFSGYYSLRYGVGGAEAAYDEILRGDDLPMGLGTVFERDVLHLPQVGSDLRLTLDLDIQQQLSDAFGDRFGGAIVLSVPSGEVIALVSQPTYDPNTLNENWDELVDDPTKPFFDRVLQASYQPGGMTYLPLMNTARTNNIPLTTSFADATRPVTTGGVTVACVVETSPNVELTLTEAFIFGCPAPFLEVAEQITPQRVEQIFQRTLSENTITLDGFITEPETIETTPEVTSIPTNSTDDNANGLGQGSLTITPMQIALLTAAILDAGNAPQPYALQAVRPPDAEDWTEINDETPTQPLMTEPAAQTMRQLMFEAVENGIAHPAAHEELQIGGYATLAYSGEQVLTWFTGFVMTDINTGYVITILLEDTENVTLAAQIGGDILATLVDD